MLSRHILVDKVGTCQQCGEKFERRRPHQKFCTPKCRYRNWVEHNPTIRLTDGELKELKKMLHKKEAANGSEKAK